MDHSVIIRLQKSPALLSFIIAAISAVVLVLNGWGLIIGITNVLPHLFYIPIILTAYFLPRRGILFACALSAIYCGMIFIISPVFPGDLLSAGGRIVMFILIAAVVSFLTLRMQESERQFRGVAERSSDIILLTDATGKAQYVSPSIRKILGYDPAEKSAIIPAISTETIITGPATPATIPVTMKMPEPMIAPMPRAVAPKRPISRFRAGRALLSDISYPFSF